MDSFNQREMFTLMLFYFNKLIIIIRFLYLIFYFDQTMNNTYIIGIL